LIPFLFSSSANLFSFFADDDDDDDVVVVVYEDHKPRATSKKI